MKVGHVALAADKRVIIFDHFNPFVEFGAWVFPDLLILLFLSDEVLIDISSAVIADPN